jgi:hypothetical protein
MRGVRELFRNAPVIANASKPGESLPLAGSAAMDRLAAQRFPRSTAACVNPIRETRRASRAQRIEVGTVLA